MKRSILGFITLCLPTALGFDGEQGRTSQGRGKPPVSEVQLLPSVEAIDLRAFTEEVEDIERELAEAIGFSRDDLLAMYGRSSAASGRFDVAATAYAMFLREFGTNHPNSGNVAGRLADCLFPFKYDEINVVHTPSGPRLDPTWRMGYTPRPQHLRQADPAFELAAFLAHDQHVKGSTLLKLGWLHRVLGDWDASTAAWDRCANEAARTKSGADALWLAAENLEWTNHPAEAAERLGRIPIENPDDARTPAAVDRIENLQAEARRSPEWLSDPVNSLVAENESRAATRSPFEVYRSVVQWLQRRAEHEALIAVSRWAATQDGWPIMDRVHALLNLVDALLREGSPSDAARYEAAEALRHVAETAPDDAWAVPAAMCNYRLLIELKQYQEADRFIFEFGQGRISTQPWGPVLLIIQIESLAARGEQNRAELTLLRLRTLHPDYDLTGLDWLRVAGTKEGEQE